jgi:electron transport complex protein RnfD
MNQKLTISLSPHIKNNESVSKIMWGVVIALMPALVVSVYFFGISALKVVVLGMAFCIGLEFVIQKFITKGKITAFDGSAAITGLLLAFNVPSSIPWWQLFAGSVLAIAVAKFTFGGLGKNPFNPALIGRAFMLASFPVHMTSWPKPLESLWSFTDAATSATPLGILAEKGAAAAGHISVLDLFIGKVGGSIGEISAAAILLGGVYMLYKKIITWHIPVIYLASLAGFTGIFWLVNPEKFANPIFHIFAGGAMLGAWFMATDMVTSPMTVKGQIIFAVAGGILCGVIRLYGSYPEGCSYSILIMNAFVPLIDKVTTPKRFGKEVNYG